MVPAPRIASFALIISLFFIFTGCDREVEGCRDPHSTNYNPDATVDDGSCAYDIDRFCGNWTFTDTITNQATLQDTIVYRTIVISRSTWNKVRISLLGAPSCLADVIATGSGNALTISTADNDQFYCNNSASISGSGQLSGNTLQLDWYWDWFMPNLNDQSGTGTAIRQ